MVFAVDPTEKARIGRSEMIDTDAISVPDVRFGMGKR